MLDARQVALDILLAWDREGRYPNILLKEKLDQLSDVRERSFCTGLVYGVVETCLQLDFWIRSVSSTPFKKIHVVNRNILRLGLYQMRYMDVPASAACNTAVNLAKKNGQYKSSGFINAILRRFALDRECFKLPDGKSVTDMSIRFSVDPSVISLLLNHYNESFVYDYFKALEELPPNETTVAVNLLKTSAQKLALLFAEQGVEVIETHDTWLKIRFSLNISTLPAYKAGLFHVIGYPSLYTANSLDVARGQTVLDLCSAPGGKTFAMAYLLQNSGKIIAVDKSQTKVSAMEKEAERLGISNVEFVCWDSTKKIDSWCGCADRVLCDVPCSGLGIIRKKPDIRYKDLAHFNMAETQRKILENGLDYLKPDGKLVYSTCTINPAENHDILRSVSADILREKTFLPQNDGMEGFYCAQLKKTL